MTKNEEVEKIADFIKNCKKCSLWKTRKKPVIGNGSASAKILFIGEAPGRNEDIQGHPFVGKAGKILDELLKSIGLGRNEIYITNILKCRPPNNRNPSKNEMDSCTGYLNRQIELIQPDIICTLGNFASSYIFEKFGLKNQKISEIHGKTFQIKDAFRTVRIIPLYHPAIATYNPNTKEILMEDFKNIKNQMNLK
ncbi:MAG: uracil-DNA glycosylase [Thermoplasmatales archaeon]|nr:MAG: uracil-DNA glycosylase [Thermoplasmatales archaeon]